MLRLTINQLLPGMTVARNIYNVNGNLILAQDVTLDAKLISRLGALGVDCLYVEHPYLEIEPQEILHEKTRVETIKTTQKVMESFQKNGTFNITGIQGAIQKIIEDAADNRDVMIHLMDIRTHDNYTFGHSINVCLLAVVMGLKMRMNQQQLFELALGALLHDIGKLLTPLEILNKEEKLSSEEWGIMQAHAERGFEVLRKHGSIPLLGSHVAFQHHENFDGSGYPRRLAGEYIHQHARIVAVADLYDAVCFDRPYRKAFLPHEAYELLMVSRGTKLDPSITDLFLENVALYPVGSSVMLDTGEIGVVINVIPKLQSRPVLKVVADGHGKPWSGPIKTIDLTKELTRFIVKVFSPEEVIAMHKKSLQ